MSREIEQPFPLINGGISDELFSKIQDAFLYAYYCICEIKYSILNLDGNSDGRFKLAFGNRADPQSQEVAYGEILHTILVIKVRMQDLAVTISDGDAFVGCNPDAIAFTISGRQEIWICPKIDTSTFSGQFSLVDTLIHEMAHISSRDIVDLVYGWENAKDLARQNPSDAVKCAENYGFYASSTYMYWTGLEKINDSYGIGDKLLYSPPAIDCNNDIITIYPSNSNYHLQSQKYDSGKWSVPILILSSDNSESIYSSSPISLCNLSEKTYCFFLKENSTDINYFYSYSNSNWSSVYSLSEELGQDINCKYAPFSVSDYYNNIHLYFVNAKDNHLYHVSFGNKGEGLSWSGVEKVVFKDFSNDFPLYCPSACYFYEFTSVNQVCLFCISESDGEDNGALELTYMLSVDGVNFGRSYQVSTNAPVAMLSPSPNIGVVPTATIVGKYRHILYINFFDSLSGRLAQFNAIIRPDSDVNQEEVDFIFSNMDFMDIYSDVDLSIDGTEFLSSYSIFPCITPNLSDGRSIAIFYDRGNGCLQQIWQSGLRQN